MTNVTNGDQVPALAEDLRTVVEGYDVTLSKTYYMTGTAQADASADGNRLVIACLADGEINGEDWFQILSHFGWDPDLNLHDDYDMDFAEIDGHDVYMLSRVS